MGAKCAGQNKLQISDEIAQELPLTALRWEHAPDGVKKSGPAMVTLPVYLYNTRQQLLFTLDFECPNSSPQTYYERGVALVCSSQLG